MTGTIPKFGSPLTFVDAVGTVIASTDINVVLVSFQEESNMSRVQLALNVADLDASIEFYTKLFGTEPAKIRDGYANFAIADPRSS